MWWFKLSTLCRDPTCDDNIQNGDEEGVDCGGSNCPPCVVEGCGVPSGFQVRSLGVSVLISWAPVSGAIRYETQYRESGTTTWTTRTTIGSRIRIVGINNSLTYEYRVRAICASEEGEYSSINTFGGTSRLATGNEFIHVYPNPTTASVNLEFFLNTSGKTLIQVYDVLGHRIIELNRYLDQGMNQMNLDLNDFASGYYMIQIRRGDQQYVERIIKESK